MALSKAGQIRNTNPQRKHARYRQEDIGKGKFFRAKRTQTEIIIDEI